jgi:hypothetical protein
MLEGSLMATPFGYSSSLDTIVPFHPPQITLPRYGNSVSVTDFSTRRGANSFVRDQQGVDPEATVTQPPSRASLGVFVPGISALLIFSTCPLSAAMATHTITTFRYDVASAKFVKKTTQRALGLNEVKIKVTHSGICYTDVHAKEKTCGLGHEGVGLVTDLGANVKSMKPGDRVGWG